MRYSKLYKSFLSWLLLVLGALLMHSAAAVDEAKTVFQQYQSRVYQVRIINIASGSKSSIGSAFLVRDDGLMATNFHVIAEYIHNPSEYRIEFINHKGETGELNIVDIDAIHDLALVHSPMAAGEPLVFSNTPLQQGESIYSLGNPRDLNMVVVQGSYNGLIQHSYYDRILFSGSINPGMSGGPALNGRGQIIGVNVATAGNALSFLVPQSKLEALLQTYTARRSVVEAGEEEAESQHTDVSTNASERPAEPADVLQVSTDVLKQRIEQQLLHNQEQFMSKVLTSVWPQVSLGQGKVIGEVTDFVRCWDNSQEKKSKRLYRSNSSYCANNEQVYLSHHFHTSGIQYEFSWVTSEELNAFQFYTAYQNLIAVAVPTNRGREEDLTNFVCHESFVEHVANADLITKSILCVRAYKEYAGLYDFLFLGASAHESRQGLISHFTLAGVSKPLGMEFTRKFMEHVQWP